MKNLVLMLLMAVVLSACTKNFQIATQTDSKWVLTELVGKTLPTNQKATLNITGGNKVGGKSFCNSYGGNLTINGNAIKIGPLIGTKMFCQEVGDAENKYLFELEHANAATITGKKLKLMKDGVVTLIFTKAE